MTQEETNTWTDYFALYRKWRPTFQENPDWMGLAADVGELYKAHHESMLADALGYIVYEMFEYMMKFGFPVDEDVSFFSEVGA